MDVLTLKERNRPVEARCVVCGDLLTTGTVCELCKHGRISSRRISSREYAEIFWEEA
jgi:hypothetical protein